MDNRSDKAAKKTSEKGGGEGEEGIDALEQKNCHDGSTDGKRTVYGEICKVQNSKGDKNTQNHNAVNEAFNYNTFNHVFLDYTKRSKTAEGSGRFVV